VAPIPSTIGHARLRQTSAGPRIAMPVQRNWYKFFSIPLTAVFVIWCAQLRFSEPEDRQFRLILIALTAAVALAKWLWDLTGQDVVTVNRSALTVRREVAGIGWQQEYFVSRISNLQYVRIVTNTDLQAGLENRPSVGYIEFTYAFRKHRFPCRLTESEAQEIIAVLENSCGAALSGTHPIPVHALPDGVIAEEVHRGRGGFLLFGWLACAVYAIHFVSDSVVLKMALAIPSLLLVVVGIAAESGYRYRFTKRGLEIVALGVPLRFIPVEQIVHYEQARWTPADRWNFGIFGRRRCFLWGGPGVRITLLDGQVYLGHELPQVIVADLDRMKQLASPAQAAGQAVGKL